MKTLVSEPSLIDLYQTWPAETTPAPGRPRHRRHPPLPLRRLPLTSRERAMLVALLDQLLHMLRPLAQNGFQEVAARVQAAQGARLRLLDPPVEAILLGQLAAVPLALLHSRLVHPHRGQLGCGTVPPQPVARLPLPLLLRPMHRHSGLLHRSRRSLWRR